ncbi:hypothetical protein CLG94_03175 [Candidatus Methylomirabilis limnetica]|uniref:Uncharacterized protein n=1 Tax=Candidatus Methylomirabilis limnetica TaxID=2033718 RepID=A0A2T4U033_9BACT|nr:hypothetical protein CLG94_03175 [Candidatus Methylomirabilis limnetica]
MLEVIRYSHLNPVRKPTRPRSEPIRLEQPRGVCQGEGLRVDGGRGRAASVGEEVGASQRCVREGVKEGHRADVYEVVDQRYLGDDAFVQEVTGRLKNEDPPQAVAVTWEEICKGVFKQCGVSAGAVMDRGKERGAVRIKRVMAWVGREVGGLRTGRWLKP